MLFDTNYTNGLSGSSFGGVRLIVVSLQEVALGSLAVLALTRPMPATAATLAFLITISTDALAIKLRRRQARNELAVARVALILSGTISAGIGCVTLSIFWNG